MAAKETRPKRVTIGALLALLLALTLAAPARAAETLDPSFGEGGISFPGLGGGDVRGLAQDAEGRLISGGGAPLSLFLVSRYLSEGALDRSFGDGEGYVASHLGIGSRANAVAVQPDGKIIAAGSTTAGAFILTRYEDDGHRRDPGFGKDGQTRTIAGNLGGGAQDVEVEPSGRILVAGYGIDAHRKWTAMLAAYRPNGALDKRFSSDGIVHINTEGVLPIELKSVEALPGGRIVAAGDNDGWAMVVALHPDGEPDRRFGGDGIVVSEPDRLRHCACSYASGMVVDRRGRIVVSANVTAP